ncbi:uncharacterized protein LOC123011482 [Tribolium madens]|uniref:uncharacterized protein LOC123011482 n=1 Tax=Tribolium madens TaxID=41895 RepID=UPI001CF72E50|nr:uncharacterized protein LOC123011482 [Tribolium madens]
MEALKVRPDLASFITSVSETSGIKNPTIASITTNQKGEGYLGEIFMVTITDPQGRPHHIVVKAAFLDEKIREIAPIRKSFQNETYFYSHLCPAFGHFAGKSPEFVPKCFKTVVEENREMLALENLKEKGFDCFDKTAELDEKHVELIFKTYGRFHAFSFALRDQNPEKYNKLVKGLCNVYGEFLEKKYFPEHLMEVSKVVEKAFVPGEDDDIITQYKKYSGYNIVNSFADCVNSEPKYAALLHGDCWSNNMMFKYQDGSVTDIRLIDWQLMKSGSPVCDLSYCLYSGASKRVFDNLDHYLRIYHDSFSGCVRELGSDPGLYPFEALKADWRKYAKFGMIMSFGILRMKLTNKEDIIDLTDDFNMDEFGEVFSKLRFNEKDYYSRIRGLVRHMHEIGAL